MMRLFLLACLVFAALHACAQGCAATPEGAALAVIGGTGPAHVSSGDTGYRVFDVQTDVIMQRVWVRVSRCGDASAPLILVPVRAGLAGATPPQAQSLKASLAAVSEVAGPGPVSNAAAAIAVHAGDAVKAVFVSTNVRMDLNATANSQAAIGGSVDITLARRGDEPAHRMHGVLRASGRVEVQP